MEVMLELSTVAAAAQGAGGGALVGRAHFVMATRSIDLRHAVPAPALHATNDAERAMAQEVAARKA